MGKRINLTEQEISSQHAINGLPLPPELKREIRKNMQ